MPKKFTLKAARVNVFMSQRAAANRLGIGLTTLSSYETGKTKPSIETGMKMAELYGLDLNDISFIRNSA